MCIAANVHSSPIPLVFFYHLLVDSIAYQTKMMMFTSAPPQRRRLLLFFGWSILSAYATAKAITVSHAPSFASRRHKSNPHPSALAQSITRKSSALVPNNHNHESSLEELLLEYRGGAAAVSTSTTTTEKAWVDGLKNSLASALAAAFSKIILAPFDTIKTLQQYHQSTGPAAASLSLLQAAQEISSRPGGFVNFYVRMIHSFFATGNSNSTVEDSAYDCGSDYLRLLVFWLYGSRC